MMAAKREITRDDILMPEVYGPVRKEKRAQLVAQVEASQRMSQNDKAQVLSQLGEVRVPASLLRRLDENRAGG